MGVELELMSVVAIGVYLLATDVVQVDLYDVLCLYIQESVGRIGVNLDLWGIDFVDSFAGVDVDGDGGGIGCTTIAVGGNDMIDSVVGNECLGMLCGGIGQIVSREPLEGEWGIASHHFDAHFGAKMVALDKGVAHDHVGIVHQDEAHGVVHL